MRLAAAEVMKLRATFLALVVGGTAALLVSTYLRRFEEEASGGPRVPVLVLVKSLEPGSLIQSEDLGERFVPQAYVEARAVRSESRPRILNLRTTSPLKAQNTLLWTDLVTTGDDPHDISSLVHPGMRATLIRAEGSAAAIVNPGDRIDVLGTFPKPGSTENRVATVLLQNVLVLGRKQESGARTGANELLLSVTLVQSETLAVAIEKGKLSVAVRSPDDTGVQDGITEFNSANLIEAEARPVARAVGPRGPQSVR